MREPELGVPLSHAFVCERIRRGAKAMEEERDFYWKRLSHVEELLRDPVYADNPLAERIKQLIWQVCELLATQAPGCGGW